MSALSASVSAASARNASTAPSSRAARVRSGVARFHTSGSARATMCGAKLKNAATTGAAGTGPSGADRPAKYPRQKPRSPAFSKAVRAPALK